MNDVRIEFRYVLCGSGWDTFNRLNKSILGVFKSEETAKEVLKELKEERPDDIRTAEIKKILWEA